MKRLVFIAIVALVAMSTCEGNKENEIEQLAQTELKVNNFFDNNQDEYSERSREYALYLLDDTSMSVNERIDLVNKLLDNYKK